MVEVKNNEFRKLGVEEKDEEELLLAGFGSGVRCKVYDRIRATQ